MFFFSVLLSVDRSDILSAAARSSKAFNKSNNVDRLKHLVHSILLVSTLIVSYARSFSARLLSANHIPVPVDYKRCVSCTVLPLIYLYI